MQLPATLFENKVVDKGSVWSHSLGPNSRFDTNQIVFGTPWWEGLPGTFRIQQLESFDDLGPMSVPSPGEILAFLENLVVDCAIPGSASESADTITKRFGPTPRNFFALEGKLVAGCVALT